MRGGHFHCSHHLWLPQSSVYPQDSLGLTADWVCSTWFLPWCWKPCLGFTPQPSALENSELESSWFTMSGLFCNITAFSPVPPAQPSSSRQWSGLCCIGFHKDILSQTHSIPFLGHDRGRRTESAFDTNRTHPERSWRGMLATRN